MFLGFIEGKMLKVTHLDVLTKKSRQMNNLLLNVV